MRRAVSELREEGKSQEGGKRGGGGWEEKRSGGTQVGRRTILLSRKPGRSTGIRTWNQKLVSQSTRQITKTKRTVFEVAAYLAMKEHLGERKGQYANPGEYLQRLTTALMHRWFFEVPFGGHGLEHLAIDNPTTTT